MSVLCLELFIIVFIFKKKKTQTNIPKLEASGLK